MLSNAIKRYLMLSNAIKRYLMLLNAIKRYQVKTFSLHQLSYLRK